MKENCNPLVSIVIPSFNKVELLLEMVDCIIKQSYKQWELLVVDDGSSEDNIARIKALKDNRINVIERNRIPKGGQTCRNIGLERSHGKYLIFFDADDLLSLNCLKQRVEFMESNPDLDFAVFPACSFTNVEDIASMQASMGVPNSQEDALTSLLAGRFQFAVWTNIYKKEALKRERIIWDENILLYQDFDFNVSTLLSHMNYSFDTKAECDYYYRMFYSSDSVFSKFTPPKLESTEYLIGKTLRRLKERSDFTKRKMDFYFFIVRHFERLLLIKNSNGVKRLVNVTEPFYNRIQIFRMKSAFCISKLFGYNKHVIYLSITLFCGDTRYITAMRHKILGH